MSEIKGNKRLRYIDAAKGMGIILVVLGHAFRDEMRMESALCEFVYQLIYSFHMPLFFVISGLTFCLSFRKYADRAQTYVWNKVRALLIPVFTYDSDLPFLCLCLPDSCTGGSVESREL